MLFLFHPKSLFEKFRRVSNFYFLVCAVFDFLFCCSLLLLLAPLLVMAATMANEFIDDFRRKLKYRVLFSVMQMQIDHV
ncbi:putative phospholipid-translocating ATPase [Medicago truncatula]|uniref:Putative phospholipid-translocating ATPase n=1 Tax=Medicago truncatula TaxID=3880 RepID=A0A396GIY2_MEDTR|nr:putative phospholipid-translocating ATPase [Medicago truncatula]